MRAFHVKVLCSDSMTVPFLRAMLDMSLGLRPTIATTSEVFCDYSGQRLTIMIKMRPSIHQRPAVHRSDTARHPTVGG